MTHALIRITAEIFVSHVLLYLLLTVSCVSVFIFLADGGHFGSWCVYWTDQTSDCDIAARVWDVCEQSWVFAAMSGASIRSEIQLSLQLQLCAGAGLH